MPPWVKVVEPARWRTGALERPGGVEDKFVEPGALDEVFG
jgi:hypothetical protein